MRLGLLARSENRGLGLQSWEFFRHLPVTKTLVVDMGELSRGFPTFHERYGDSTSVVSYQDGGLDEAATRHWLRDLDVVFTVETLYDPRFHTWANDAGVATVIQLNPEFIKPDVFEPTVWWAPTTWRLDSIGVEAVHVPVPVALDRFTEVTPASDEGPLRVLHVVGHRATADRNGTQLVHQALRYARKAVDLRVITQDDRLIPFRQRPPHQTKVVFNGVKDYWELYRDANVLLLPRRYGGLSLVVQEAAAAGLALVLTDCSPNETWPSVRVPARQRGGVKAPGGLVPAYEARPQAIAAILEQFTDDRELVRERQRAARAWAEQNSWDRLRPLYLQELERAITLANG